MPPRRPRRAFAIEHRDAEPLTRADIQLDLLSFIFNNQVKAFTDASGEKVSFHDLYINAILHSKSKSKGVLNEKLSESPAFATDFAKLALLINVGRIATTMSFFAEMRTAVRTYHPIACLMSTNGNLLDAPRIKSILKACTLEGETNNKSTLATPAQIIARAQNQPCPVISMPNLITIFTNHSEQVGRDHIPEMEFRELFLPTDASSESRARAFLWLCHRYYEGSFSDNDYDGDSASQNPFSDPDRPGKTPRLVILAPEEAALENVDPEEEKELAKRLIAQREAIVQNNLLKESAKESKAKASSRGETPSPAKSKGKRTASAKAAPTAQLKRKMNEEEEEVDEAPLKKPKLDEAEDITSHVSTVLRPVYRQERNTLSRESLSPYPDSNRYDAYEPSRPRTMLQHAWHTTTTSDPLAESDDEPDDEHFRRDHAQRLRIIARLRGKPPTPEPDGLRTIPLQLYLDSWHDDVFV